jgi:hypothetical protein
MAQVSGTFSSYDAVGNREDLTDFIYDISPTETPILNAIGRTSATATLHEWQTDALAAASTTNAVIEGDDTAFTQPGSTTRLNNYTQIQKKSVIVSGTQDAVRKAGRRSELAYQLSKRGFELRRDMEATLSNNQAKVAGDDTTARTMAGLPSWINSNVNAAGNATEAGDNGTQTRTDGTQRAFTEAQLKDVVKQVYDDGGNPSIVVVGTFNKQTASGFTGIATKFKDVDDMKTVAAADVYVSDFGELSIVPDRFTRPRDAWVLDPDFAQAAFLRRIFQEKLAKTGDAEKRQMIVEWTLAVNNPLAHGAIFDLTVS